MMKLVTGLLPASGGEVRVAGQKVTGPIKVVGMAFQNPTLLPWRTTLDNVLLPLEIVEPHKRRSAPHAPSTTRGREAPADGRPQATSATSSPGSSRAACSSAPISAAR